MPNEQNPQKKSFQTEEQKKAAQADKSQSAGNKNSSYSSSSQPKKDSVGTKREGDMNPRSAAK